MQAIPLNSLLFGLNRVFDLIEEPLLDLAIDFRFALIILNVSENWLRQKSWFTLAL
jgi:hypothetical protein